MHTKDQLKVFEAQVEKTKSLGRDKIIEIAARSVSGAPEVLIKEDKIVSTVWYNKINVKVNFNILYPIKYIALDKEYLNNTSVYITIGSVSSKGGSLISNIENKNVKSIGTAKLYISSKVKELKIKEVIALNNTNAKKYYLDNKTQQRITIKEKKAYYDMQLGDSYSITYKIDKTSGEIYDYKDLYDRFYPTPVIMPNLIDPIAGEWIEMKA